MTKCDFCEMSSPKGKCHWSLQASRESDCRKAIERMVKALGDERKKKKHFF